MPSVLAGLRRMVQSKLARAEFHYQHILWHVDEIYDSFGLVNADGRSYDVLMADDGGLCLLEKAIHTKLDAQDKVALLERQMDTEAESPTIFSDIVQCYDIIRHQAEEIERVCNVHFGHTLFTREMVYESGLEQLLRKEDRALNRIRNLRELDNYLSTLPNV